MADVKQPGVDDEKARQLALYRRKLSDYREVETKLKDLRKKVCLICLQVLTLKL
jgi:FMN phosphatase YigB (HAD superfamily)